MSAPYHDVPNNPLGTDVLLAQIEKLIQERALWRLTAMSCERDMEEAEQQADELRARLDASMKSEARLLEAAKVEADRIAELEAEVARLKEVRVEWDAKAARDMKAQEAMIDRLAATPKEDPALNAELLDALVRLAKVMGELSFDRWRDGGNSSFVSISRRSNEGECVNIDHDGTPSSIARAIIDAANELLGEDTDTDTDTPTTEARER